MLSKTFTLLFYMKKPKNYDVGKTPIYMHFTVNGQRIEIATKRECEPEKWNASSGRKTGLKEDVRSLNAFRDSLQTKVYEAQRILVDKGMQVTANGIKDILTGVAERQRMVMEIFKEHNQEMNALIGKDFARVT